MVSDFVLGSSTWTISGLLPDDLRLIADNGVPCPPDRMYAVRTYFVELVSAIIHSKIKAVEIWYSSVMGDPFVFEQLERLAGVDRVASMHAPAGWGVDLSSMDEEIRSSGVRACIAAAEILSKLHGRRLVTHASMPIEDQSRMSARIDQSIRSFQEIADACWNLRVTVAMELLPSPLVGSSASELIRMLESIDRPNVGICLDVNHVFPTSDLVPTVRALGSRILTLHIADCDGATEKHWLPGMGVIDWPGLLNALDEIGYEGPFIYETRFGSSTIDDAIFALEENYLEIMGGRR
jgi:hexosaminidase